MIPEEDAAIEEPDDRPVWPRMVATVVVAAVLGLAFIVWLDSDPVVELEDDLIAAFDEQWDRDSNPSWCAQGCSATDHEWHTDQTLAEAREAVEAIAAERGVPAEFESVSDEAGIMTLGDDVVIEVGITTSAWPSASPEATGTAVWFTSVTVFDE